MRNQIDISLNGTINGSIRCDFNADTEDTNYTFRTWNFLNGQVINGEAVGTIETPNVEIKDAEIILNNKEMTTEKMSKDYLQLIQPYYKNNNINVDKGICEYHFGLKREELNPNGVINMGSLKKKNLIVNVSENAIASKLKIYCIGLNVLQIKNGNGNLQLAM